MKRYEFKLTLAGEGDDELDAWLDAVESFSSSPGLPPTDYEVEEDELFEDNFDWASFHATQGDSTEGNFNGGQ